MGWLIRFQHKRKSSKEIREYFERDFKSANIEIVDYSLQKWNEVYLACKDKRGMIFGMVCLIRNTANHFGHKDIHEETWPYYYNAPKRLIKKLSPTKNENALTWRKGCLLKRYKK